MFIPTNGWLKIRIFTSMNSLLITPKDASEMQFLTELLQKLGLGIAEIPAEALENAGLLKLMQEVDTTDLVSGEEIFRKF